MTLESYIARVLKDVKEGCEAALDAEQTVNVEFEVGMVPTAEGRLEVSRNPEGEVVPNRLRFTVAARVPIKQ